MNNLNYGIAGNCRTAYLVSETGAIDWLCLPYFDSSSVFARLLDKEKGGTFEILVDEDCNIEQSYIRNTNILCTRYTKGQDSFEVLDFMPRYKSNNSDYYYPPDVIRYFIYRYGKPSFRVRYMPALEYAKYKTKTIIEDDYIKSFTERGEYDSLYLYTNLKKEDILNQSEIFLEKDAFILLSYNQKLLKQTMEMQYLQLHKTKAYWIDWAYSLTSFTKYQREIVRSALVLKLLSFEKTGAVLAAVTTSLPESIGRNRNWDYRYCWIRDASMVVRVLAKLGHLNTVKQFMNFIIDIIPDKDEKIQIMYGINRQKTLREETLDHLSGYEDSKPVRIGNAAYLQKQNDIYGVLMDVIYQQFKIFDTSLENSEFLWTLARSIVKIVEENWRNPDKGIWEIRTEEKHFTFSKVLCWVAIDRGISIARIIRKDKYAEQWRQLANEIREDILKNAWNDEAKSFTQFYGSKDQDAANLLMESYGFIDANDEKYKLTVKAIEKDLCRNGLMYRYRNKDDFGIPSSAFIMCTFWLINSLQAIGESKRAVKLFDDLLKYSNHVGLFSEDIDFESKRLLGNFPQAYSHLALIETAIKLSKGNITDDEKVLESIQRWANLNSIP